MLIDTGFPAYHQIRAVRENIKHKRYLIADEMGTGKTAIGILTHLKLEDVLQRPIRTLVICPNSVKRVWYDRIQEYCEQPQKIELIDSNDKKASLERARNSDFTIINYELIFRSLGDTDDGVEKFSNGLETISEEEAQRVIGKLKHIGFPHVILDEGHNAKNPEALRSKAVESIAKAAEYLTILSGTPLPNHIDDIGMMMTMLEPETYKTAEHFNSAFKKNPELVHLVLSRRMQRKRSDEVMTLPDLIEQDLEIELPANQRAVYDSIYDNPTLNPGDKLLQLRKALINPSLVRMTALNTDVSLDVESERYRVLDSLLEEKCKAGKVVVFTSLFKEGVTKDLEERYQHLGALRIDGDISADERRTNGHIEPSDRERVRREFQYNPNKRVLIATTATMKEGVELTAADTVIFLDKPYTPAEYDQAYKRVHRRGQEKPVTVISFVAKHTVDEGIEQLLDDKRRVSEMVVDGKATRDDMEILRKNDRKEAKTLLTEKRTPRQILSSYSRVMRGKGSKFNLHLIDANNERIAKSFAENYLLAWDGSYSDNTSRALKNVLGDVDGRILDIGSGPGILSRVFNQSMVNVDINRYQLENAERICREQGLEGLFLRGLMHNLGAINRGNFQDKSFDTTLCSLAFHYNDLEERVLTLQEINRILKVNGLIAITLPYSVVNLEGDALLREGMQNLGFQVEVSKTGFVRGIKPIRSNYKGYILVARKIGPEKDVNKDLFVLNTEEGVIEGRGWKQTGEKQPGSYDGVPAESFAFFDPLSGETLKEAEAQTDITDLIRKFHSIESIPEEELARFGYKRELTPKRGRKGNLVRIVRT